MTMRVTILEAKVERLLKTVEALSAREEELTELTGRLLNACLCGVSPLSPELLPESRDVGALERLAAIKALAQEDVGDRQAPTPRPPIQLPPRGGFYVDTGASVDAEGRLTVKGSGAETIPATRICSECQEEIGVGVVRVPDGHGGNRHVVGSPVCSK